MRIIFMGTPDFAVPCLNILFENNFDIVAVVTAPDRKSGRGQKIKYSAVKAYALEKGIKILQPVKLRAEEFLQELKSLNADLQVVVAFRMLPEMVWSMPPNGTVNIHASLLPDYRGAAPINWAIINGEKTTGVTSFFIQQEIDTGNIIFQKSIPIEKTDNAGSLHDKLMNLGASTILETVKAIEAGNYPVTKQDASKAINLAPKIFSEDCKINFSQNAEQVFNFVRGLSPYPGAWCYLNEKIFKVYSIEIAEKIEDENIKPYDVFRSKKELKIATLDYWLNLKDVQPEKKRKMDIKSFLAGFSNPTVLIQ